MSKQQTGPLLLDASAILALLRREEGAQAVQSAIRNRPCAISSVTLTELEGKLIGRGEYTATQVRSAIDGLAPLLQELPFDAACRERTTFYYARKSPYDLSLADAACLGTAEAKGMNALTAEEGWKKLPDLPITVELIR